MFFRDRMEKDSKDARREERKQRAELERLERERAKKAQGTRNRMFLVIGVLTVLGVAILGVTRKRDQSGRVWSAEHGHWHDK